MPSSRAIRPLVASHHNKQFPAPPKKKQAASDAIVVGRRRGACVCRFCGSSLAKILKNVESRRAHRCESGALLEPIADDVKAIGAACRFLSRLSTHQTSRINRIHVKPCMEVGFRYYLKVRVHF